MLLQSSSKCNDLGQQSKIKATRGRRSKLFTIIVFRVWFLKCFLPTICLANGLNDLTESSSKSYGNISNWGWLHAQHHSSIIERTERHSKANLQHQFIGQSIRICSGYNYAESAKNFFNCLHEIASYLELNESQTINNFANTNGTQNNELAYMREIEVKDKTGPETISGAKNIKNFIEIFELFLCLLIAGCVELLPVGWQHLRQWQQQRFQGTPARQQESLAQGVYSQNQESSSFCLKFSLWQWLLSSSRTKCTQPTFNRKQQQFSKAKQCLNAFLTVKLPLTPSCLFSLPHQQVFIKETVLQEYALIVWNIIVHEMTRITTNDTKSCCLLFYVTPEGTPPLSTHSCSNENTQRKRNCNKDRLANTQTRKSSNSSNSSICRDCHQVIETSLRTPASKRQINCTPSVNVCSFPGCHIEIDVAELNAKQKAPDVSWKSLAGDCNRACCCGWRLENTHPTNVCNNCCCSCCCCSISKSCCCSICCCFCNVCCSCSWCCCCVCQSKDCFCYVNEACSCFKITPQPARLQRLCELIFGNSISRYFRNICQNVRTKLLNYIQKLCSQRAKLRQRHQRERAMRHAVSSTSTLAQRKNVCIGHHGIANCTTNYQQLEASNVCKFFCNNRKRQRRRRRKRRRRRRRHCSLGAQECRGAAGVGQFIKNENGTQDFSIFPLYICNQETITISLLSSFLYYLKSAVKTITKTNNYTKPQQPQDHHNSQNRTLLATIATVPPQTITKSKHHNTHGFRRVYCRGIKSWPNLAWLFIGLVWFESSRLVDCDFQQPIPTNEQTIAPKQDIYQLKFAQPHFNALHECNQKYSAHEKIFLNQALPKQFNKQKKMGQQSLSNKLQWKSLKTLENGPEFNVLSDQIRLESIKNQILSKLGLTMRPNVSHPLPKQFIWDTISRVDELDTIMKNFDHAASINTKSIGKLGMGIWTINGWPQTVQVRAHRNSTHAPHQSYSEYSEQQQQQQQYYSVPQQQQQHQQQQINRNKLNNKKLTYLSGITSDMKVPVTLVGDESHLKKSDYPSPRHASYEPAIDINNALVSDLHRYQHMSNDAEFANDADADDDGPEFHGKTEEIISFAEEGDFFSHHRLIEFRTGTKEVLTNEKLYVRKAEIHLRIDAIKDSKSRKKQRESKNLKIWIFRMTENNVTQKELNQEIIFCDAFEIDTQHLGWKKLDLTSTVRDWFALQKTRAGRSTDRLRLLIDCTGCGDQYRLKLFESLQKPISQYENNNQKDIVALWLQQELENRNATKKATQIKFKNDVPQESYLNPDRPFLVIKTERNRARRVRRRVVDCSGALRGQCCKESFYVSFKALGWDDWIIAPRGYFANYCRGDCTGPFRTPDTFQTFHAHFIEEYRKMGLLNGMKPCCAPIKFSSMSLIYYGDDGIIKRDLPKMVVDECGCP